MTTTSVAESLPGGRYSTLRIPAIAEDDDSMSAAFRYVNAGLYIGPLDQGRKNPGSILGGGWPSKTSRSPEWVVSWFERGDAGPFLHCGRSGILGLDVDRPEKIPVEWWPILATAPFQSTRVGDARRGHYIFAQPEGRTIGSPNIPGGGGECRGTNGVIVLSPTRHAKAATGGRYAWVRTGPIPYLPALIADQLPDGKPGESAVTDAELAAWMAAHTDEHPHGRTFREAAVAEFYRRTQERNESRHSAAVVCAAWIARDVAAGWYGSEAFDLLRDAFAGTFDRAETAEGRGSAVEWQGVVSWAVGQVTPDDVTARRARLDAMRNVESLTYRRNREPEQEGSLDVPHALNGTPSRAEVDVAEDEAEARAIERQAYLNRALGMELDRQRVTREARRRLDEEEAAEALARADFGEQYLTRSQLANIPRPLPMIEGVLARHSTAILRGRDGTFKSFVAFDWALSIATGHPWMGRTVDQGRVLYVMGEGAPGVADRIDAWEAARGLLVDDEAFIVRVSPVNLFRGGAAYDDLLQRVRDGGFSLVVLDTLRRVSGGADGNGSDMGLVVDRINEIREATDGGTVLTIAHTDKGDNDTRGYSGIEDDTDIVWHAKRDEGSNQFSILCAKNKNERDGMEINLAVRPSLESLVIDSPVRLLKVEEPEGGVARRMWTVLTDNDQTGVTQADLRDAHGFKKSTVSSYVNRWAREGRVEIRGRYFIFADRSKEPTWTPEMPVHTPL